MPRRSRALIAAAGLVLVTQAHSKPAGADAADSPRRSEPAGIPGPPRIESQPGFVLDGDDRRFALARRTASRRVETDEYVLEGEKIGTWKELLTVQQLTLASSPAADRFLSYFRQRIERENNGSVETLENGARACVFAVRFPRSETSDEQVMVCLAYVESAKPGVLNVVQYAIKPTCLPLEVVSARIQSWRDRFVAAAAKLGAK